MVQARTVIPEDFRIHGKLTAKTLQLPPNSIRDQEISSDTVLEASKRGHRHTISLRQQTIADVSAPVHVFRAAGTLIGIEATCGTAPTGDREVSIELHKGNAADAFASILAHPILFDADHNDYEVCRAPIAEYSADINDVLQVVVDISGSTGTVPTDLVVTVTWEESPKG